MFVYSYRNLLGKKIRTMDSKMKTKKPTTLPVAGFSKFYA